MKKSKRNQAGFTLIELAIIIAVLGILGAVGAVKLASMTDEANLAAEKTALANARSALAIAIAKDETSIDATSKGKVTEDEFAAYLVGYDKTTKTIDGTVKIKFDNATNITTIDVDK